jgi:hypothetical protein
MQNLVYLSFSEGLIIMKRCVAFVVFVANHIRSLKVCDTGALIPQKLATILLFEINLLLPLFPESEGLALFRQQIFSGSYKSITFCCYYFGIDMSIAANRRIKLHRLQKLHGFATFFITVSLVKNQ